MNEGLPARNKPRDAEQTPEINEQLEKNIREQFNLRLLFAEALSEKKGIPVEDALRDFTDAHVRITGRWARESKEINPLWEEFAAGIHGLTTHDERLHYMEQALKRPEAKPSKHEANPFGPFDFNYSEKDNAIDIHFGSLSPEAGDPDAPGVLSKERLPEMRQKLKEMFTKIKADHPDAEIVRGTSWLYNREAYRRLYPATYTATPNVRKGNFLGGGTWGQFRDKTGAVNKEARETFLKNLEHLDLDHLEDTFPNKTLVVSAPITEFYKEYAIE